MNNRVARQPMAQKMMNYGKKTQKKKKKKNENDEDQADHNW